MQLDRWKGRRLNTSILVPFRDGGCTWRARAFDWVRAHYARHHPDLELVTGTAPDGPWSKGTALADARARARGNLLVIADADIFVDADDLHQAVGDVAGGASWAVPYTWVHRLDEPTTSRLYAAGGVPGQYRLDRLPYRGMLGGGIVVVPAETWDRVPIDPRFRGWGGEDESWGWALKCLVGPPAQRASTLWHLWHPHPAPEAVRARTAEQPASVELRARYRAARAIPRLMRAAVAGEDPEPAVPLAVPARFRSRPGRTLRAAGRLVRFRDGSAETTDPDVAEVLARTAGVEPAGSHSRDS